MDSTTEELPIICAPDLPLKSVKTFIMTRSHRFNFIQVGDVLFIGWNDSSDPSAAETHIKFKLARVASVEQSGKCLCVCANSKPRLMRYLRGRVCDVITWGPGGCVWWWVGGGRVCESVCMSVNVRPANIPAERVKLEKRAAGVKMTAQNWEKWKDVEGGNGLMEAEGEMWRESNC